MPATTLYSACVASAIGLYLLMRGTGGGVRGMGTIVALGGLGWLLSETFASIDGDVGPTIAPLIFGVIAVMAAVRVITHRRPVFAALYFILVVIASAGLFLMLHAEFMAFALIIVYAGAILITYMFVLMLAQQSPTDAGDSGSAWYDRTPREPAIALLAGFILLATLVEAMDNSRARHFDTMTETVATRAAEQPWIDLGRLPRELLRTAQDVDPDVVDVLSAPRLDDGIVRLSVRLHGGTETEITLPQSSQPSNTRVVGLALVADYPVSLELAGVILLMAMFGAVVLCRKQIELGEDEAQQAAGISGGPQS
ncbi:MAG: NADH-quinone oxidoreductase subunit J [Phycisphaerales bacterium]|nr:NADH-quinone oxidoreductase subunit J [Phycisphaerales bacterium]